MSAADVAQALRASAVPFSGETAIDDGAGLPRLETAYAWLLAGHQGSTYVTRTPGGTSAAFRRTGLTGPDDTLQLFLVRHAAGLRAAQFLLKSDASWLSVPPTVVAGARETEIPVTYQPAALTAPGVHVGVVSARNVSDPLAGPIFLLANTVVVPFDLNARPMFDERRAIGPARVQRYFLRVPEAGGGATIEASVTLPDSTQQGATARLYEPDGQPSRDAEEIALGHTDPGTGRFVVRGEDLVPGVYELDVFAPPLAGTTATVRAALSPLALTEAAGRIEATNLGVESFTGRATQQLIGAGRTVSVAGRGTPAESVTVRVPDWAARAVVDVTMPREQWDDFTDFGVTDYDSTGQQVGQGALNYAIGRHTFTVAPSLRGHPLTIELFPAFARDNGAHPWPAEVGVRFLLAEPRPLGDGTDVRVVPGGRAAVALDNSPGDLPLPEGFTPLVELRVHGAAGAVPDAVRRVALSPR